MSFRFYAIQEILLSVCNFTKQNSLTYTPEPWGEGQPWAAWQTRGGRRDRPPWRLPAQVRSGPSLLTDFANQHRHFLANWFTLWGRSAFLPSSRVFSPALFLHCQSRVVLSLQLSLSLTSSFQSFQYVYTEKAKVLRDAIPRNSEKKITIKELIKTDRNDSLRQ